MLSGTAGADTFNAGAAPSTLTGGAGDDLEMIVLIPPSGDRPAQAGFENLARTLSVEWARYRVTTVAVAAGPHADGGDVAEVVCYLVSVAGDYFSGCRFDLGVTAARR